MAFTTSPNMNLIIPTAGSEAGPTYALDINSSLTLVDQHDHTSGSGVPITPAAININTDLAFNNHFATQLAGLTLLAQATTPALSTLYQTGVDLYFIDGSGNTIRLTQSGGIAGTPGSITNLVFPASVNYVAGSQTFVFQSLAGIAGNLDAGSLLMRNLSPNSTYALTLTPPNNLSANYTLTLPSLPASQKFMTLDAAGTISAPWEVDDVTIKIVGNQLVAQADVLDSNKEHSWELNGNYAQLSFPLTNIDAIFLAPTNITITSVWIYNGDVGSGSTTEYDLLVASPGGSFTSILSQTGKITSAAASTVWTDSGSIIPSAVGVQKPLIGTANITAGQAIRFDILTSMFGPATDARIRIFYKPA